MLVAGGYGAGTPLSSAELYDPATGTWNLTGNLLQGRAYHAATLLPNGEVLVVGGYDGGSLSSAELYNPATGTWSLTGSLNAARHFHTATLLLNGKVLVLGGHDHSDGNVGRAGYLTSAELYDPATGTWSPTGNLNTSYYWHTATMLPNGKVLLVGSLWFGTSKTTELYDPATGTWTLTGSLNVGRVYHAAILLPNGNVLVLGGYDHPSNTFYNSVELYRPDTGTWSFVANLETSHLVSATLLLNGKVLVLGGRDGGLSLAQSCMTRALTPSTTRGSSLLNIITTSLTASPTQAASPTGPAKSQSAVRMPAAFMNAASV